MFKSVGLVARFDRKRAVRLVEDLAEHLSKKGLDIYLEDTLAKKTEAKWKTLPLDGMRTDLIVTVGGDGTILRACLSLPKPEPPILAVNMGIRGFLTEVEPKQAFDAVDKCLKGEYTTEKCMKLATNADNTDSQTRSTRSSSLMMSRQTAVLAHSESRRAYSELSSRFFAGIYADRFYGVLTLGRGTCLGSRRERLRSDANMSIDRFSTNRLSRRLTLDY